MRIRSTTSLVVLLFGLPCCKGSSDRPPDATEGCATDENAEAFTDYLASGRVMSDAARAPRWLEPAPGSTLAAAMPATLRWQPSPTDAGRPNGTASCPDRCPTCRLSPEHLPPVSGNVFELRFSAGGAEVYRVMTSLQSFTPDAAVWATWAGQGLTVDLVGAALLRNEVAAGPFRTETLRFSVRN